MKKNNTCKDRIIRVRVRYFAGGLGGNIRRSKGSRDGLGY